MADFSAQFQAYGGDSRATLERFMGNEAMYLRFLAMLPQDDSVEKLERALAAEDLDAAFEAAHTLKGVAGNLGLTPLYEAACAIVEPLRAREQRDYLPLCRTVRTEFQRACDLREQLQEGE